MPQSRPVTQALARSGPRIHKVPTRSFTNRQSSHAQVASAYVARRQLHFVRSVALVTSVGTSLALWQWFTGEKLIKDVHAEAPADAEVVFEKPKKTKGLGKEDVRDLISSQHLQVKRSWENPGVYAWGSNSGKVVAPDSQENVIKRPQRIPFFDGRLLRDLKLDRYFGAAIDEKGNLLQWGTAFSSTTTQPTLTLRGKNLQSLTISRDRIIGMGKDGKVYSVPVSQEDQEHDPKPLESTWIPFWNSRSSISYRRMDPENLSWGEKVTAIAGGAEHILLMTSKGRVFSAASSGLDFPSRGQLGIPGLTWLTRPSDAYDQPHEITTLRGFDIQKVAAGEFHSLALDRDGRVFSFGDNSLGQLGFDYNSESSVIDAPSLIPIQRLYAGTSQTPQVTGIAAGGSNSYFTIDATKTAGPKDDASSVRGLGRMTADTWACGHGIWGSLGNGRWTHIQGMPTKIPALSGLFEYDEVNNKAVPIRLARLSVGATHAAAVMNNITYLDANAKSSKNDTNWGADILFFGNNEYYQLGTGKRNNISNPAYIQALDVEAERKVRGKEDHRFHITPRKTIKVNGKSVSVEQRIECGKSVTAVYSGL
ncbi:MAG: hypothetical protein M1822_005872 [Bathelium mastoideum]|nr:MAG: hypothetical protein M1822_005872 [Bathelium mastoideum]